MDYELEPHHVLPDDALWPDQQALQDVAAPDAWNVTVGSKATTVCIIDSGIDVT